MTWEACNVALVLFCAWRGEVHSLWVRRIWGRLLATAELSLAQLESFACQKELASFANVCVPMYCRSSGVVGDALLTMAANWRPQCVDRERCSSSLSGGDGDSITGERHASQDRDLPCALILKICTPSRHALSSRSTLQTTPACRTTSADPDRTQSSRYFPLWRCSISLLYIVPYFASGVCETVKTPFWQLEKETSTHPLFTGSLSFLCLERRFLGN